MLWRAGPLSRSIGQAAQQEPLGLLSLFDDPEDRFDQLLLLSIRLFGFFGGHPGTVAAQRRFMGTYLQAASVALVPSTEPEGRTGSAHGTRCPVDSHRRLPVTPGADEAQPLSLRATVAVAHLAVYFGDFDAVGRMGLEAMRQDLAMLGLAPGMSREEFNTHVAVPIAQAPIVREVLMLVDKTGDVTEPEFIGLLNRVGVDRQAASVADLLIVLQRWLSYSMTEGYETTQASIKLIRAKRL